MPDFAYIARNLTGQRVEGTLVAGSEREALSQLAGRDLFPVKVTADKKTLDTVGGTATIKVPARIVVPVYSQLASLLRSGVPLLRSLQVISEQSSNEKLRKVLEDVRSRVEDGANLSDAMAHNPKTFDELSVSIVRAGGEGGFLEDALERVADFTEQQGELQSRVMGALAYPMMLMVIGTSIVTGLMVFVVPKFESMFETLKSQGELPMMTTWLLGISAFLVHYGLYLLVVLVGLYFLLNKYLKTPEGKLTLDRVRLRVPMAGNIYLSLAVARFCRVLGTLLRGGVPIVRSLEIASDSTGNKVLMEAVNSAAENITSGQSLAEPLGASGHFPRNVVEMIAVAEQSNSLETVLTQIADTEERQTWRKLDLAVRLLEPLLLVVLAIVVLMVVMALLLPVLKMNSGM